MKASQPSREALQIIQRMAKKAILKAAPKSEPKAKDDEEETDEMGED